MWKIKGHIISPIKKVRRYFETKPVKCSTILISFTQHGLHLSTCYKTFFTLENKEFDFIVRELVRLYNYFVYEHCYIMHVVQLVIT